MARTAAELTPEEIVMNSELIAISNSRYLYKDNSGNYTWVTVPPWSWDVVWPASATDNAVVRFDSTTWKLIQNSVVTIADTTWAITWSTSITLGTASSINWQIIFNNSASAFTQTFTWSNPWASINYILPTTAPTDWQVLSATAPVAWVSTLSWATWWWGSFSWWATASGTSWTWVWLTIAANSADDTTWSSVTINATQTVATWALYWYSVINNYNTWWTQWITPYSFNTTVKDWIGLEISWTGTPTASYAGLVNISTGNTNSSFDRKAINITITNNIWSWDNSWIYIGNASTSFTTSNLKWSWLGIVQTWTDWTALWILWDSNVNASTNWLFNLALGNTQSWASIVQKINLWTSTQWHTWILINAANASTSIIWIKVDMSTTWTWTPINIVGWAWTNTFSIDWWNSNDTILTWYQTKSWTLTWRSSSMIDSAVIRTHTAATTITDSYNAYFFGRSSIINNAWWTFNNQWAVMLIQNSSSQTAGTMSDSVDCLDISQWSLSTGYPLNITQSAVVSTNFKKIMNLSWVTIWKSDWTTPNWNLSWTAWDVCFNGTSWQPFYCTWTTNWTAL